MAERSVTEDDVRSALGRRIGSPAAASPGKVWVYGYAGGGRILKVLLTSDEEAIITVAWPDN